MRKASGLSCEDRAYRVRREIVRERTERGIDHACPWPERLETALWRQRNASLDTWRCASLLDIQDITRHCYRLRSSCLGELRQENDYYKFWASISYVVSSRPVGAT